MVKKPMKVMNEFLKQKSETAYKIFGWQNMLNTKK